MKTEYEVKVLDINVDEIIKTLEKLGAKKVGEFHQRRYVYDFKPRLANKWIRLRTNGTKTTLAIKEVQKKEIDGTKELETEVNDFDTTNEILIQLGYMSKGYQENKRISYILDDVELEIDSWPLIPTYLEIEGKNEDSVYKMLKALEIPDDKVTALDVQSVYAEIYGIDIEKIKELKF